MDIKDIMQFCESFSNVTYDNPFGPQPKCCRVGGKIFAEIYPSGVPGALRILRTDETIDPQLALPMVTLRCEPEYGLCCRQQYPDYILRPYHCPPSQHPYACTVILNDSIPDHIIKDMIAHAYMTILKKLPKKTQQILQNNDTL